MSAGCTGDRRFSKCGTRPRKPKWFQRKTRHYRRGTATTWSKGPVPPAIGAFGANGAGRTRPGDGEERNGRERDHGAGGRAGAAGEPARPHRRARALRVATQLRVDRKTLWRVLNTGRLTPRLMRTLEWRERAAAVRGAGLHLRTVDCLHRQGHQLQRHRPARGAPNSARRAVTLVEAPERVVVGVLPTRT